jgi:type I restriction enzyme S subunit
MDLEFPVPPAEEQQRIVAALEDHISRLDQGRGLVDRCVIRTQHLRHAVLDRLFSPEFVEKSATSASLGDFVVDSRGGWSRGARHLVSTEKGVPYLKMNNITIEGVLNVEDYVSVAASADEHRKYQLEIGDVLFNSKNSAELVGKTAAVTSEVAGWVFNENIICIRFHPSVIPEFAAMQMNSNKFRRHMEGIRSATTNVAAVYMRDLRRLPFWIPSITKQEQIVAEYMAARDSLKRLELATRQTISRAAVLRKSLLREAFAGQLVPQDPEAEPASALLERVRAERATVPAPKSRARLTGAIPGQTGSRGRTKSKNTSEQETLL